MATELAKAYVQIIPSARGIQGKITEELGGEAKSAGKSAGGSIAGAIKTAIAAAGIGAALKQSLFEGADLQQSIGGIETLFKDSATAVIENAKNAYKTAGMSANEYMETVTSFSASLLQGLGGDTAAAASVADMALTDMADNANKMGTSMEMIQNAYQGFAKQNYTMLDNLKLGYGGTQKEMARLLADAQKISGVKYDISNLSDIYNAIHVIQGEMGITGATAAEASETFSGSLAAMKAAASNLLGNLSLGEDIGPSLNDLQETVHTFVVGNLFPMIGNVLSNLPDVLSAALSTAIGALNLAGGNMEAIMRNGLDLVYGLAEAVIMAAPYLINAGLKLVKEIGTVIVTTDWFGVVTEMVSNLRDGLDLAAGEILGTDGSLIGSVCDSIRANAPMVVQKGLETIREYANGLKANLPELARAAGVVVADWLAEVGAHLPDIFAKGLSMIGEFVAGAISAIPDVIRGAAEIISNFLEGFSSYDWKSIGLNIIEGIKNGLSAGLGAIAEAAKNVAKSALDSAKKFLGIASPSKVMRDQVGNFIPEGVAAGIKQNMSAVTDAMDDITKAATGAVTADLSVAAVASVTGRASNVSARSELMKSEGDSQEMAMLRDLCEELPDMLANAIAQMKLQINRREFGRLVREV